MIMREYHTHQAIVTSYRFGSYGNATVWGTEVEQAGVMSKWINHQFSGLETFTNSDGCYSLVGENKFTSIRYSYQREGSLQIYCNALCCQ